MAEIKITIPDNWIDRTLEAFNGMAEKNIEINFENGHKNYTYPAKGTDNNLVFGKKVMVEMIKNHIFVYELSKDNERYRTEINGIEQPTAILPDDIII